MMSTLAGIVKHGTHLRFVFESDFYPQGGLSRTFHEDVPDIFVFLLAHRTFCVCTRDMILKVNLSSLVSGEKTFSD